jgi:hypothetical protein
MKFSGLKPRKDGHALCFNPLIPFFSILRYINSFLEYRKRTSLIIPIECTIQFFYFRKGTPLEMLKQR